MNKSGRKAIKFAILVFFKYMFVQLYCFEFFFIRIESLSIIWGPAKKKKSYIANLRLSNVMKLDLNINCSTNFEFGEICNTQQLLLKYVTLNT